ncbi:gluconolactonase [Sulfodiicoccus acidiphilus]|uniref:Gluconolaconase n=1 Tax=Sulfodiicoccus acidiphilus TaxID=1670455 RepID=A0A348B6A3_9CREN|nr:SMP-30/gluconolactonase/LRE family protein [Sulfodiicoccus acidiphilus]BBD73705.1 gluconolactonase [Sulfodiicoccus acidiphilus]GGT97767.1 gluconolaconase [Sulfodiicoccus acidiphilus]
MRRYIDIRCELAESPLWHDGRFLWVDIRARRLYVETGEVISYLPFDGPVSSVNPSVEDTYVVTVSHEVLLINIRDGVRTKVAELREPERTRFNDAKCDKWGKLLAGTMDLEEKEPLGSLYSVGGGETKKLLTSLTISNGIAWDLDYSVMYHVDTPTGKVWAYDYGRDGTLWNRRVAVDIPAGTGLPDGITADEEGMLWVAHWGGSRVSRWDPKRGRLLSQLPVPANRVTSVTFGGPELTQLFVTTASGDDGGGFIYVEEPGVRGRPPDSFRVYS